MNMLRTQAALDRSFKRDMIASWRTGNSWSLGRWVWGYGMSHSWQHGIRYSTLNYYAVGILDALASWTPLVGTGTWDFTTRRLKVKVIVAGSRSIADIKVVTQAIEESGFEVDEVVSGTARGVDTIGEEWAKSKGIPVKKFPADWNGLGKRAGFVRNAEMADYADALVAVWDGKSRGTENMIEQAKKKGLKVYVKEIAG